MEAVASHAPVASPAGLAVRALSVQDITDAIAAGYQDFRAAPLYGLFFGGVYAVGGLLLTYLTLSRGYTYMAYPLMAGFALIGPFVAVGLYQVSRLRERGEALSWARILGAVFEEGGKEIGWMALVSVFIFVLWIYTAGFIYALFFGLTPVNLSHLFDTVISTPRGLGFLVAGNIAGALLALGLFAISVISYPLLMDRDVDFITAMITSVRVFLASPGPLLGWAAFIALMLMASLTPMFLGLFFTLPLLGHATWHLYGRAVPSVS